VWSLAATFTGFTANIGVVNAACTAGGDPNPPYYGQLQYTITCGTRFCRSQGYFFGMIVEWMGSYNNTYPYQSSPTTGMIVDCSK